MKLKTSYCKLTTFKKDLTRFAPVWALYLIGILMVFTELGGYSTYDRFANSYMNDIIASFGIVNICYAGVCALVLFGDLYNTRMCYSLHTQPARRESLFLSHTAAAMCFSFVPNLVAALILMTELEAYWTLALYWLLASQLQFLFYFGLAAVSAMCAGNRVGLIAVYAVLNFFSMIAYWVVNTIYLPQMTGVLMNFSDFSLLCPTVELFSFDYFQFEKVEQYLSTQEWGNFYKFTGLGTGWGYMAVMGGLGALTLGLSVVLYRLRHLESAGDFVAFRKLSPVVCVVLTVCVAVGFAFLGDAMGNGYMMWLGVGLVIGFFGSRMLLERRVKVFRPKVFLAFGMLVAVVVASFLVIAYDVLGIVRFLPEQEKVESVTIYNYKTSGNYYEYDFYYGNRISATLDEPEQIADIIAAHQDVLDRMENYNGNSHRVTISYKLKSGRTVLRSYAAPADGLNYSVFKKYFYTPEQIMGYTDWDSFVENIEYLSVADVDIPPQYYEEVLLAMRADCENGDILVSNNLKTEEIACWACLRVDYPDGSSIYRDLAISNEAVNTIELMKTPKIILGFEDASEVNYFNYMYVDGNDWPTDQRHALLEALMADIATGDVVAGYGNEGRYSVEYFFEVDHAVVYRHFTIYKYAENTIALIENITQ